MKKIILSACVALLVTSPLYGAPKDKSSCEITRYCDEKCDDIARNCYYNCTYERNQWGAMDSVSYCRNDCSIGWPACVSTCIVNHTQKPPLKKVKLHKRIPSTGI